jgi:hypothetical protein
MHSFASTAVLEAVLLTQHCANYLSWGIWEDGMFKFVAPLLAAVCVVGVASTAQASSCSLSTSGNLGCSLSEGQNSANAEYGVLSADDLLDVGGDAGWFVGWTFLLENGTDYTGAASNPNVSDIVHIYSTGAEVWSKGFDGTLGGNSSFGANFGAILNFALGLTLSETVQVVGDPLIPGGRRFYTNPNGGEIGLVNEGPNGLALLEPLSGMIPGCIPSQTISCGFGSDSLSVQSAADETGPPPDNTEVPEPATLTLMGIGGAIAAIRRRRKAA